MTLARPLRTQCVDGNADCCIWEQSGYMETQWVHGNVVGVWGHTMLTWEHTMT
jgi:hypothetical protein